MSRAATTGASYFLGNTDFFPFEMCILYLSYAFGSERHFYSCNLKLDHPPEKDKQPQSHISKEFEPLRETIKVQYQQRY